MGRKCNLKYKHYKQVKRIYLFFSYNFEIVMNNNYEKIF